MQPELTSTRISTVASVDDPTAPPQSPTAAQRWLLRGVGLLAGMFGLYYGYGIGSHVSGIGMGVVMALNSAVIAAMLTGAVAERLRRAWVGLRGQR